MYQRNGLESSQGKIHRRFRTMKKTKANENEVNEEVTFKLNSSMLNSGKVWIDFIGPIDPNFFNRFMEIYNSIQLEEDEEFPQVVLTMNSTGGDASIIKIIPIVLQSCGITSLISYGNCASAALSIMLYAKQLNIDVYMDSMCMCCIHRASIVGAEGRSERITKFNDATIKK
jgi:ATP-dependent protease ClpP protease subunit